MTALEQLLAIARNTLFESIRQPIVLVVAAIATLLIILSNPLAAYTLEDDQRMFVDIALSTMFIASAIVAAFIATNVLSREIENKTVLTVVSKPVSRPTFVLGKYLGVAVALLLVVLYLAFAFMLAEMHGVLKTVRTPIHQPVLVFSTIAVLLGVGGATWANYFYGKSFSSTALLLTTPLAAVAYLLALLWGPDWSTNTTDQILGRGIVDLYTVGVDPIFEGQLWIAIGMMTLAVLVIAAIALAASTRLGQVLTLCVTLGVLLLGLLSDWLFARKISELAKLAATAPEQFGAGLRIESAFLNAAYAIVPNFQVFWLADAVNQDRSIPMAYISQTVPYGLCMIGAALCIAVSLFQRREVG
ncbi:MAG: ABC transporter permease [Phycisphaerae bacterium]|jgi:ABC-2 type transport system permease protein|nr:ABC transporter permease [Phycisphaerae bacterium]